MDKKSKDLLWAFASTVAWFLIYDSLNKWLGFEVSTMIIVLAFMFRVKYFILKQDTEDKLGKAVKDLKDLLTKE